MQNHPGTFRAFFATLAAAAFLALTLSSCAVTVALPGGGSTTAPITQPPNTGTGAGGSPTDSTPTTGGEQAPEDADKKDDSDTNGDGNGGKQEPTDKNPSEGADDNKKDPPPDPGAPKEPTPTKPGDGMVIDENCTAKWDEISNKLVLTSYTLPSNKSAVTFPTGKNYIIGAYSVRENNSQMITVTLPNDVIGIEKGAFQRAWIKEINIPSSITQIGDEAFYGAKLEELNFGWSHSDGNLGNSLFSNCDMLQKVTVSGTIKRIPSNAFSYCANLQTLKLPDGLESIGAESFASVGSWDTPNLNIVLPESITTIEEAAFANSSIKALYIPRSIQEIDVSAFGGTSIKEIYFEGTETEWEQWDSIVCSNLEILDYNEGVKIYCQKKPSDISASTPVTDFLAELLSIFL